MIVNIYGHIIIKNDFRNLWDFTIDLKDVALRNL